MAWLSGWKRRIPIIIDPTTISGGLSEDLSDFPLMLKISNSSGRNNSDITKVFDELPLDDFSDNFTGTNGSTPDETLWQGPYSGADTTEIFDIQSNQVRLRQVNSGSGPYQPSIYFRTDLGADSRFKNIVTGDFSASIDYDLVTPGGGKGVIIFYAYFGTSGQDYARVYMSFNTTYGHNATGQCYVDGDDTGYDEDDSLGGGGVENVDTGSFRIRRSGNTVYCDYNIEGSGWTNLVSRSHNDYLQPLYYIRCHVGIYQQTAVTQECRWDNFSCTHGEHEGEKIAVTLSDGTTQCPVEIESWKASNNLATLWTKVPTIASGTDTTLYLYYNQEMDDNDVYVGMTTTSGAKNVWTNGYDGVWHMAQEPSAGASDTIFESTSNGLHGTPQGSLSSGDLEDGLAGKAIDFNGSSDYIGLTANSALNPGSQDITVEGIFKVDAISDYPMVMDRRNTGGNGWYRLYLRDTSGEVWFSMAESDSPYDSWIARYESSVDDGNWHYAVGVKSGDVLQVYVDSVSGTSVLADSGANFNITEGLFAGVLGPTYDQSFFDGPIDEIRVSVGVARTEDYIRTNYQNVFDKLVIFDDAEYNVSSARAAGVTSSAPFTATVYGSIPSDNHDSHVSVYFGQTDGGTTPSAWESSVYAGLKASGSSFDTTLSGIIPFKTYYYRFYTTYSGSEPSEDWTPSYSFYLNEGRILKGTSSNFVAVYPEPDSTFYNTNFACVSRGEGAGFNVIRDDEVVMYWPSTVSGTGNTIRQDASDLTSVR